MKYITPIEWHTTPQVPQLLPSTGYGAALPHLFNLSNTTLVSDFGASYQFLDEAWQFIDATGHARTFQKIDGNGKLYTPHLPFDFGYYRAALDIVQGVLRVGEDDRHAQEIALQSDGNESEELYSLPSQQPMLYVPCFSSLGQRMNIWKPIESLQAQYGIPRAKVNREVEDYLIRMLVEQPRLDGNDLTVHSGVRIGSHVWFWNPKTNHREHHSGKEWVDKAWKYAFDPDYLDENGAIPDTVLSEARHYIAWLTSQDPNQLNEDNNFSNLLRTFRGNLLMGTERRNGSLFIGNGGNGRRLLLNQILKDLGGDYVFKMRGSQRSKALSTALYAINNNTNINLNLSNSVLKTLVTGGLFYGRLGKNESNFFISKAYPIVTTHHVPGDQDAWYYANFCYVKFYRAEADFEHAPIIPFLKEYGILPMLWLSLQQAVEDSDSNKFKHYGYSED